MLCVVILINIHNNYTETQNLISSQIFWDGYQRSGSHTLNDVQKSRYLGYRGGTNTILRVELARFVCPLMCKTLANDLAPDWFSFGALSSCYIAWTYFQNKCTGRLKIRKRTLNSSPPQSWFARAVMGKTLALFWLAFLILWTKSSRLCSVHQSYLFFIFAGLRFTHLFILLYMVQIIGFQPKLW